MSERRYTDEEVQRILADAAQSEGTQGATGDAESGMTLAEIQRAASEVGLSSAAVTTAAVALDRKSLTLAHPRVLGLRSGVAETASLVRPLSDVEWRKFVAVLRDTFEAPGREEHGGGRWEWRNGNLRVTVESVGEGALLEMRTQKESARALVRGGLVALGMSGVFAAALAAVSANPRAMAGVLVMTLGGAAMAAVGALQLPAWLSARRRQFAAIADYARRITAVGTEPGSES
jgi:hypothetical protein